MDPLPFGQEELGIFTAKLLDRWEKKYVDKKAFRDFLVKRIYYHPLHPENHNVRLLNNQNCDFIEIWTGSNWIPYPSTYVLKDIDLAVDTVLTIYRHKKLLVELLFAIQRAEGMPNTEYVTELLEKCDEETRLIEELNKKKRLLGTPNKPIRSIAELVNAELEKCRAGVHRYQIKSILSKDALIM
jgi:hypothetical protein